MKARDLARYAVTAATVMALVVARPGSAAAQRSDVIGIGIAGAWYGLLGGSAFNDLDPGFGFEATGRYAVTHSLTVGAGVRHTSHDLEDTSIGGDVWGVFGEARFLGYGGQIYPYGGLRAGYIRKDFGDVGLKDSGLELAALVGVGVPLMPGLALELGGTASFALMDQTGSALGLVAGLSFWFP